jgi:predicted RNase H-like HicB family nuclease
MQFTAVYMQVPEGYIAFVEELPGANTQAATLEEAKENLQETVAMMLETNRELTEKSLTSQRVTRELLIVDSLSANGGSNGTRPAGQPSSQWTKAKNQRRCELVDKEIEGTLSPGEGEELEQLQAEMLAYRRRVAPLPLKDLREIHDELLQRSSEKPE